MAKIADLYADIRANASQAIDELKRFANSVKDSGSATKAAGQDWDAYYEKLNRIIGTGTLTKFEDGLSGQSNAANNLTDTLTALAGRFFTVAAAYKAVRWVAKATQEYVDYSREILRVERLTGMASEESSKLIQISDQLGLETGALTAAMQQAIKKGYDPSIDGIKQMSIEYIKLGDSMSRALYIQEHFGMRGQQAETIARLLELGPTQIETVAENIKQGLIFDAGDMFQAHQTEQMISDISDAYDSFKYQAGNILSSAFAQLFAKDETKIAKILEYAKQLKQSGAGAEELISETRRMAKWYGLSINEAGNLVNMRGDFGVPVSTNFAELISAIIA